MIMMMMIIMMMMMIMMAIQFTSLTCKPNNTGKIMKPAWMCRYSVHWYSAVKQANTKRVFWDVATCGRVIAFRRFAGTYRLYLQRCATVNWLRTQRMQAALFFETSGEKLLNQLAQQTRRPTYSTTTRWKNLNHCFRTVKIYLFLLVISSAFIVLLCVIDFLRNERWKFF
jgi:hypothetical protein